VQGGQFLQCCKAGDYEVTIGPGILCPVFGVANNLLSCKPNQEKPPTTDSDQYGGSKVVVISTAPSFCEAVKEYTDVN